ncbi:MAG: chemotaxis protein CheW [Bdellovibrionales bacterium]|nr:chemotaxis protein CheW [Bdellovibrionales bacterium]
MSQELDANKYMEFSLGSEKYAVPLLRVREVISIPAVTPIPRAPAYFHGIMNLRGQIISVMDLRKKLGVQPGEDLSEESVIILSYAEFHLGIVVDSINRVLQAEDGEIKQVPVAKVATKAEYIDGVIERENELIIKLNVEKALSLEDLECIRNEQKEQSAA